MAFAFSDKDVTIAADDTDLMIILLHCIYKQRGDLATQIYVERSCTVLDIKKFVTAIPNNILIGILLAHAFCGCGTTSSIFDMGQVRIVKVRLIDIEIIASFYSSSSSHETKTQAGEKLMFQLYAKSMKTSSTDLNELRYEIYIVRNLA